MLDSPADEIRLPVPSAAGLRLRPAERGDAMHLARLVDLAGEGLPSFLWSRMKPEGMDVWAFGAARAARDEGAFSWRNATIAEIGGQVAGAVVAYDISGDPAPTDGLPPMARPLQELENLVPGTRYVNVLATYPVFRRMGVGRSLLEAEAAKAGRGRALSIIVADRNMPAFRLYEALGYRERARRPVVRDGWYCESREWVLLTRPS